MQSSTSALKTDVHVYSGDIDGIRPHSGRRIAVEVHGATLNKVLSKAVDEGLVRCQLLLPHGARTDLPGGWAFPCDEGEVIVAAARVRLEELESTGVAVLIARRGVVPFAEVDPATRDQIASALVDAVLAMEVP
jgi:hypothetical protein